jgi:hypothetical protein
MQIGGKYAHEYDVEKKTQKRDKSKKILFHASLLGNELNIFQTKFNQMNTTISYGHPNRPSPMNHCHCNFTN